MRVLVLACVWVVALGIKFQMRTDVGEQMCFFEILQPLQKYSVEVQPMQEGVFQFTIGVKTEEDQWQILHEKRTKNNFETISYHKLASHDGTYSFCTQNQENREMKFRVEIRSGIELMDFELLPDKSDAENLERELGWLQNQKRKLFESLERMEGLKATSDSFANLMSRKMVIFAILGLCMLVVVNACFYRVLKEYLKKRKII